MAEATSPTTGRRYGVARVCQIWDQPRSSFYAARPPQEGAVGPASPSARRGPKPSVGDEALLAAIHADLGRSPWTGEGHRKVWAPRQESRAWRAFKRTKRSYYVPIESTMSPVRVNHTNLPT